MKISIIIPTFNDKNGLIETLKSIKAQNYKNYECIVIDGKSEDGTSNIIKNSQIITKWISEKDQGIYDAINKGIKISNGELINTINCGDYYFSERSLEIIVNYFKANPDISFIYGAVKKNKIYYKYEPKKMWWTFNFYPSHSGGFFVKTSVHRKIGLYDLNFPCSADYDFFWRLIKKNNFKGMSTKKHELISVFQPGGFSSKYGVYNHIWEETKIRIKNKQNFLLVSTIFLLRIIRNFYKFSYFK